MYKESKLVERLEAATKMFKENPEDKKMWNAIDEIDKEIERHMLKAKKKCRTGCAGKELHSESVNKEGAGAPFCELAMKCNSGAESWKSTKQKISSRKMQRVQKMECAGNQHTQELF